MEEFEKDEGVQNPDTSYWIRAVLRGFPYIGLLLTGFVLLHLVRNKNVNRTEKKKGSGKF